MREIFLILFLFCCFASKAQENEIKITVEFKNVLKKDAIEQIERLSEYRFFYLDKWLDKTPISGNYIEVTLPTILDDIFKNTVINYHILDDGSVILTQNALIFDKLASVFYDEEEKPQEEIVKDVIVLEEPRTFESDAQIIRIGKQRRNNRIRNFRLTGVILNTETNEPIPNMVVSIASLNINEVTNNRGAFTMTLPSGQYLLQTKALGYQDKDQLIALYSSGNLELTVDEAAEALEEVVIEADAERNVREAVTGITQINVEDIKTIPLILGERDILKVATTLPGIKTSSEGSIGYNVRGGKEDQNLILLDNGVLYNPSHFFGVFSAVNPFSTGSAEIYKGNAPIEFGGRLSSVFDIKTKTANFDTFKGEVSVGPVTSNVTLEVPIKEQETSLLIGSRATYSNWILRSLDEKSLKNSSASFFDGIAKLTHKIDENNTLEATAYLSNDDFSITSDSIFTYQNRLISVNWNKQIDNSRMSDLSISNSQYDFNIEFESGADRDFDLKYRINETQLKYKFNHVLNENHTLDYGISSKLYMVHPGEKTPKGAASIVSPLKIPKEKGLESAIFISDIIDINEKLQVNLGLRYSIYNSLGAKEQRIYEANQPKSSATLVGIKNYDNNQFINTEGGPDIRASLRYLIDEDFSVKASFNNTYQYIQSLSNNTTVSPTVTWKLSDLNFKPQQSNQVTLGFYKNVNSNEFEFSIEGYYKKSNNILDYKVGADLLLNETIETEVLQGKGKAYGVEFLMKKNRGNVNGWLGYTYSRTFSKFDSEFNEETINNGDYFPSNFDKPHDLSLVTNFKFTRRFSMSANFSYQTGRPVTYPIGEYQFNNNTYVYYSDHNKFRIPDYYRLDLGFNVEGNHKIQKFAHSFWNVSVYNVLGRNNPHSVYFVTDDGEIKAYQSSIFSIPVPTITYNFKF